MERTDNHLSDEPETDNSSAFFLPCPGSPHATLRSWPDSADAAGASDAHTCVALWSNANSAKNYKDAPRFLFGYGSLIETRSRVRTWPTARHALPAIVRGVVRGWFKRTQSAGPSPTYLGAVASRDAAAVGLHADRTAPGLQNANDDRVPVCNGVLFPVTLVELQHYDAREADYTRERILPEDVEMLDGSAGLPAGSEVWFYATRDVQWPCPAFPIVMSYVDICLTGCLEIEYVFPLARAARFAERFVRTCVGWTWHVGCWINDRVYPRRAFAVVPEAARIDQLIVDVLGPDALAAICFERSAPACGCAAGAAGGDGDPCPCGARPPPARGARTVPARRSSGPVRDAPPPPSPQASADPEPTPRPQGSRSGGPCRRAYKALFRHIARCLRHAFRIFSSRQCMR